MLRRLHHLPPRAGTSSTFFATTVATAVCAAGARFINDATLHATRDVPRTPGGQNAFKVLEYDLSKDSSTEAMTKQFKAMAVKCHPDRPGGSHEKMSELNAAFKIAKENLNPSLDKLSESTRNRKASAEYRKMQRQRANKEDDIGKTGGIYASRRVNVAREQASKYKTAKELQTAWETMAAETGDTAQRMVHRFEVAVEQCLHFKKLTVLHEISVRERWLRKMFVKHTWEQVHEMRQELLRKGARSQQQSALAEEMVAFATATERKLTEDFQRQSGVIVNGQLRVVVGRAAWVLFWIVSVVTVFRYTLYGLYSNAYSVKYREAFWGTK